MFAENRGFAGGTPCKVVFCGPPITMPKHTKSTGRKSSKGAKRTGKGKKRTGKGTKRTGKGKKRSGSGKGKRYTAKRISVRHGGHYRYASYGGKSRNEEAAPNPWRDFVKAEFPLVMTHHPFARFSFIIKELSRLYNVYQHGDKAQLEALGNFAAKQADHVSEKLGERGLDNVEKEALGKELQVVAAAHPVVMRNMKNLQNRLRTIQRAYESRADERIISAMKFLDALAAHITNHMEAAAVGAGPVEPVAAAPVGPAVTAGGAGGPSSLLSL